MIKIAITVEAFEAIAFTLPLALWPNPDQTLRRAFSRAKDRYLGAIGIAPMASTLSGKTGLSRELGFGRRKVGRDLA